MRSDGRASQSLVRVVRIESVQRPSQRLRSVQRPCDGTSWHAAAVPPAIPPLARSGGGLARCLAPAELGAINPHAMQHHRQLARQRNLRPLQPTQLGEPHRPGLQRGKARDPAQHDVGRLEQCGSHHRIPDLGDPARPVHLAGLILAWRQSKIRADILGLANTATTGPTPGAVIKRQHTASSRTMLNNIRCSLPYSARRLARACK